MDLSVGEPQLDRFVTLLVHAPLVNAPLVTALVVTTPVVHAHERRMI